ncbi:MAG TPA: hypothetical protein EYF95_08160 [Flavobacteriales bacterium]|nr:hypothetical protein [Flavobacteriales bacterium]HIK67930.1 hypothetical protein [Flavobacteriales bacterium]
MKRTPLQELLAHKNARIDAEAKRKTDAQAYVGKNAQKELFTKKVDGKDKFFVREDDGEGNLRDQEITKLQYESDKSSNEYINSQRKLLGLDQTDIATDDRTPVPKPGILKRLYKGASDYLKGDSGDTPPKVKGDIIKKNIENNVVETNTNPAGVTDPIANAGGGKVKTDLSKPMKPVIKETPTGLPMDVTNQAQTSKIHAGTPETEKAFLKSQLPNQGNEPKVYAGTPETKQAYESSLLKGKPPPGLSDRDKANIADGSYRRNAESLDARRNQLQQNIDTQKAKPDQSPNVHTQIAQTMKRRRREEMPRIALPNKEEANRGAQQQLANIEAKKIQDAKNIEAKKMKDAKDRSFIASAKSSNKKAKEALGKHEAEQRHNALVNSPAYIAQRNKSMASVNYKEPTPTTKRTVSKTMGSFANTSPVKRSKIQLAGRSKNPKSSSSIVERRAIQNKRYPSKAEGSNIVKDVFGRTGILTGNAKKDKAIGIENKEKRKMALKQIGGMFKRGGFGTKRVDLESLNKYKKK